MKLAILIGVSEYESLNNLAACLNDVILMDMLITNTQKYDDKLVIKENTNSYIVKEEINNFIRKYKDKNIEELFFYFSGHGAFENNEFYYVLSDYNKASLNSTTIKNTDIDLYIKSLNPNLAVKVVDACQSGVKYVKQTKDFVIRKVMDETKNSFNDCFFMFSSNLDQSSFANDNISFFTESFIKSVLATQRNTLRYTSISDFISDDFSKRNTEQNPFFIIQGDLTHEFCIVKQDLKNKLTTFLKSIGLSELNDYKESKEEKSVIDIIREEAKFYCKNIEEVGSVFNNMKKIYSEFKLIENYDELFDVNIVFDIIPYRTLKNIQEVAKSIEEKKNSYFIDIHYKENLYKVPRKKSLAESIKVMNGEYVQTEYITHKKIEPDFFEITEAVPFTFVEVTIIPKEEFPNLPKLNCISFFAFSKVDIDIYYSLNVLVEKEWYIYELSDDIEWLYTTAKLKDEAVLEVKINNIKNELNKLIKKQIEEKYLEWKKEKSEVVEPVEQNN
jgi:Caspase domain